MQGLRMQQTMPEDRSGWHHIDAGPHLEVLFHPDRRLAGRDDQIPLPVAEAQSPLDAIMAFFEKPLRFRGLLALAEEDDVAAQLRDEELKKAASQIRARAAAHK